LYGQTEAAVARARTMRGGKLHVADDGVPLGPDGFPLVGDRINGWVGVSLLQVWSLLGHVAEVLSEALVVKLEPTKSDSFYGIERDSLSVGMVQRCQSAVPKPHR
jgi:hypothetical protein